MGDDARALDRGAGGDARVIRALLVMALVVLASAASGAEEPAGLAELRQRAARDLTGTIEGRAYFERARPSAADEPLAGLGVLVIPRSPELIQRLEGVKRQSRESMRGFREAAPAVRAIVDDAEREIWRAGYPDVIARTATDRDGRFRAVVPAGAWLVMVTRSVFLAVDRTPSSAPARTASALDPLARYTINQYQHFLPTTRMTGFDAVSVWLREVDVDVRQRIVLELHDRGVWLSGVVEETALPRRTKLPPRLGH